MKTATKWHVRLAKTLIGRVKKAWVLSYRLCAQRRLLSDWADAQANLSLSWAHMPFYWFCHEVAQIMNNPGNRLSLLQRGEHSAKTDYTNLESIEEGNRDFHMR